MTNFQQKHYNPLQVKISQKSEIWYKEYRGLSLWKVSEKTLCLFFHLPFATSLRKSRIVTPRYPCFFPTYTTPWAVYLLSPLSARRSTLWVFSPVHWTTNVVLPLVNAVQILKPVCRSLSSLPLTLTAGLGNAVMLKFNPEPLVPSSAHCPKHLHTSTTSKCLSLSFYLIYTYNISYKWVHPSHFFKYFIIYFHVTTLKKWHFATM